MELQGPRSPVWGGDIACELQDSSICPILGWGGHIDPLFIQKRRMKAFISLPLCGRTKIERQQMQAIMVSWVPPGVGWIIGFS